MFLIVYNNPLNDPKLFWVRISRRVLPKRSPAPPAKKWTPSCTLRIVCSQSRPEGQQRQPTERTRITMKMERHRRSVTLLFKRVILNITMILISQLLSQWHPVPSVCCRTTRKAFSRIASISRILLTQKTFNNLWEILF